MKLFITKNTVFILTLILSPFFLFAQWNQMGSDILGESAGDDFGRSTSINAAGNIVVSGSYRNTENGDFSGQARVFEWDGTNWNQLGEDINGDAPDIWSGWEVAMDASGHTIAVTTLIDYNKQGYRSGLVKVYDWDGSTWNQRGNDIEGEGIPGGWLEWFGNSLSFGADGNMIAIGGPLNKEFAHNAGFARVYNWNGNDWVQMGEDIDAEGSHDEFGFSVDLNEAGNILAVGGPGNFGYGNNQAGYVKTYSWDGTNWNQHGSKLPGEVDGDEFGRSVSLNASGDVLAIGAYGFEYPDNIDRTAYVFEWDGNDWAQRGDTFTPDATNGGSFGEDVCLNAAGDIFAVGSPALLWGISYVQFFQWTGNSWIEGDNINDDDYFGSSISLNSDGNIIAIGARFAEENGHVSIFENLTAVGLDHELAEGGKNNLIYPNPSTGDFYIQSNNLLPVSVSIFGINGELVYENEFINELAQIQLNLPNGIYMVVITSENKIQNHKLVVTK